MQNKRKRGRQGRLGNQAKSDMEEEWGTACEGFKLVSEERRRNRDQERNCSLCDHLWQQHTGHLQEVEGGGGRGGGTGWNHSGYSVSCFSHYAHLTCTTV